jgi:hypothetical protein
MLTMAETTTDPLDLITIFAKHTGPTSAKMTPMMTLV